LSNEQYKVGEGDSAGGFSLIAGIIQAGFDAAGCMNGQCDPHVVHKSQVDLQEKGFYASYALH
jgi:hypothetical protein